MTNTIVTIAGPTCSGKSTLADYLARNGIPEVQSFTTRKPRAGEDASGNGSYQFVSHEEVRDGRLGPIVEQVEFQGNTYGNTVHSMQAALKKGRGLATVVVEPHGVIQWKKALEPKVDYRCFAIYLQHSTKTLVTRFQDRLANIALTDDRERVLYEVGRLQNMLESEIPFWSKAAPYDLIVPNLDATFLGGTHTKDMVRGFLEYTFRR